MLLKNSTVLIIEPANLTAAPYCFLSPFYQIYRTKLIDNVDDEIIQYRPDLFLISCSYSPTQLLNILQKIFKLMQSQITPIIFVVDLKNPISNVPGTSWGGHLAVLDSNCSQTEFDSALKRISP